MNKKMGRPKTENPKSTQLSVRLNSEELKQLDEITDYYKISRVAALRKGISVLYGLLQEK